MIAHLDECRCKKLTIILKIVKSENLYNSNDMCTAIEYIIVPEGLYFKWLKTWVKP